MKPTLQLKVSQQLRLTPQLQQSIRLLQLSTVELNQEIERMVQENPLLELGEEWGVPPAVVSSDNPETASESADSDAISAEAESTEVKAEREEDFELDPEWQQDNVASYGVPEDDDLDGSQIPDKPLSLREHLNFQTCLSQISEREKIIIGLLIDSLDEMMAICYRT